MWCDVGGVAPNCVRHAPPSADVTFTLCPPPAPTLYTWHTHKHIQINTHAYIQTYKYTHLHTKTDKHWIIGCMWLPCCRVQTTTRPLAPQGPRILQLLRVHLLLSLGHRPQGGFSRTTCDLCAKGNVNKCVCCVCVCACVCVCVCVVCVRCVCEM